MLLDGSRSAPGYSSAAILFDDPDAAIGINDRVGLMKAEEAAQRRIAAEHARAGVTFLQPGTTRVEAGVTIGRDTVIAGQVGIAGSTKIGDRVVLVGEERERKPVLHLEAHVRARSVRTDAEDDCATLFEHTPSVANPARLSSAARCVVPWIEIQDDCLTGKSLRRELHAAGGQRLLVLRDLIALRQIGIEIVLAGKDAPRVHRAPQRLRRAHAVEQRTKLFGRRDVAAEDDHAAGFDFADQRARFGIEFRARKSDEKELSDLLFAGK